MLKRLPLWMGLAGAAWMIIAVRLVALRAILITNYIGLRVGFMFPPVRREVSMLDVWILNTWVVVSGGIEFALLGMLVRSAIRRLSNNSDRIVISHRG